MLHKGKKKKTNAPPRPKTPPVQAGFSLIELLIVVAIILIIAAIAIPNFLRAKIHANEASAVQSIRTINTAQVAYQSQFPDTGYALTIAALGGAAGACGTGVLGTVTSACLIDNVLSNGQKSGYTFATAGTPGGGGAINNTFTSSAVPTTPGSTGQRGFFSDDSGVIRYTINGVLPTTASSALQ